MLCDCRSVTGRAAVMSLRPLIGWWGVQANCRPMRGQAAGPGQPTHSHSQSDYAEYLHFTNNDLIALYEENNAS